MKGVLLKVFHYTCKKGATKLCTAGLFLISSSSSDPPPPITFVNASLLECETFLHLQVHLKLGLPLNRVMDLHPLSNKGMGPSILL